MRGVRGGRGMRGGHRGAMMDEDTPHEQRRPARRGEFEDHDDRTFTEAPQIIEGRGENRDHYRGMRG